MSEEDDLPCTFAGFKISGDKLNGFNVDKNQYLKNLEHLPATATLKLGWLGNSRADCAVEISRLAHVTDVIFKERHREIIKRINRVMTYAVDSHVSLKFPKLDLQTLQVVGFSDASFANNYDLTSQLGHIVFITMARGTLRPFTSSLIRRSSSPVLLWRPRSSPSAMPSMSDTPSPQNCPAFWGGRSP